MLTKGQKKALETVVHNYTKKDPRKVMRQVYYADDYIYATDTISAYRLPNTEGEISLSAGPCDYPVSSINRQFEWCYTKDYFLQEFTPEQCKTIDGMKFCKIGNDYYDCKQISRAVRILGKNLLPYQRKERYMPLYLKSEKGEAIICPVRIY